MIVQKPGIDCRVFLLLTLVKLEISLMQNIRKIAVFCGSAAGADPGYIKDSMELASAMNKHKISLVYGGGNVGLMGSLADEMIRLNGEVIGVIPKRLVEIELAHNAITKLHIVEGMHERKALMTSLADAFIVLPGGIGTMEEFFEIFTWHQLGYHNKPIALSNINGYYDIMIAMLNRMVEQEFVKADDINRLIIAKSSTEALHSLISLTTYKPVSVNLSET